MSNVKPATNPKRIIPFFAKSLEEKSLAIKTGIKAGAPGGLEMPYKETRTIR